MIVLREKGLPLDTCQPIYLGIDPGVNGGLAAIRGGIAVAQATPETEEEIWEWIGACARIVRDESGGYAVIERVSGWMGGHRKKDGTEATSQGQPGSAMFKFGMSYGGLRMALVASGIPFDAVTPQVWMKHYPIFSRNEDGEKVSRSEWKRLLKAEAQRLFPNEKVTLKTCDALLLAYYCRSINESLSTAR